MMSLLCTINKKIYIIIDFLLLWVVFMGFLAGCCCEDEDDGIVEGEACYGDVVINT